MDGRNQSYITYEIEVILYVMLLKNICSVESMQEMVAEFNEDECIKNIYKILGLKEKQYLPHYVTINECLSKLDTHELEKIRKGMVYNLIRKKSFDDEKTIYYYQVLEAKIVLGDDLGISIATEFIENEKENVSTSE